MKGVLSLQRPRKSTPGLKNSQILSEAAVPEVAATAESPASGDHTQSALRNIAETLLERGRGRGFCGLTGEDQGDEGGGQGSQRRQLQQPRHALVRLRLRNETVGRNVSGVGMKRDLERGGGGGWRGRRRTPQSSATTIAVRALPGSVTGTVPPRSALKKSLGIAANVRSRARESAAPATPQAAAVRPM